MIADCAYCRKQPLSVWENDNEHGPMYNIECKACRNWTGFHIGVDAEAAAIESWNYNQDFFQKYAVPYEPKIKKGNAND